MFLEQEIASMQPILKMDISNCPEELAQLGTLIERSSRQFEGLKELLGTAEHSTVFTDTELHAIAGALAELSEQISQQKQELASGLQIWERDILVLERKIDARRGVIRQYEDLLADFPTVLTLLAAEQVNLESELQDAKGQIGIDCSASRESGERSSLETKEPTGNGNTDSSGTV